MMTAAPSSRSCDGENDERVTSTFFISNLHCPSCISSIEEVLGALDPPPDAITHSIISHCVVVRHRAALPVRRILTALEHAGFEVHSLQPDGRAETEELAAELHARADPDGKDSLEQAVSRWRHAWNSPRPSDLQKRRIHLDQCEQCRLEATQAGGDAKRLSSLTDSSGRPSTEKQPTSASRGAPEPNETQESRRIAVVHSAPREESWIATLTVSGMTCASCVGAISRALDHQPWVRSVDVNLLTNTARVIFTDRNREQDISRIIEEAGYDVRLESVEKHGQPPRAPAQCTASDHWRAVLSVTGMTCSSCVNAITRALENHEWIRKVDVNLLSHSATVEFEGKDHVEAIRETIEDIGYEAALDSVVNMRQVEAETTEERVVVIKVDGMFCHHCPPKVVGLLEDKYGEKVNIDGPFSDKSPYLRVRYRPDAPAFTIRNILETIQAGDARFTVSIYHPPTIEDRARAMLARERRRILLRLILSVVVAIPTFLIGIVWMDLVHPENGIRKFFDQHMWTRNVTRAQWALFILATPVYFLAADTFHVRALKELKALWRPGSPTPLLQRFYRFGSMNMLMSLGTSIAYFASIAELAIASTQAPGAGGADYYFDSVVFLTMFLLIGRFLEAFSKAKTGDAVTSLGKLRPTYALLTDAAGAQDVKIPVDQLEVGDLVRVPHGASPPFDGDVVAGSTKFDESSLTGESRPIKKEVGDTVYSGTVNKGGPVTVRLTTVSGTSMLDQIIKVVREGQARRAPIERASDLITGHFVPFVVLVAVVTWIVWLALGLSGTLPDNYRDANSGSWVLWSLRFAIAVFVVACPCGIGLAAPTALFVGGGLAARHGILVKGGGEAFQEASQLDCIVFDKTGTLTQGGDPAVTDHEILLSNNSLTMSSEEILNLAMRLEENSSHPVARAIVSFCRPRSQGSGGPQDVEEIPGKGLQGTFNVGESIGRVSVIIGNERFMTERAVAIAPSVSATLDAWKGQGKSVALLAISATAKPGEEGLAMGWQLSAIFAISDPIRGEAPRVVRGLQDRGIDVWMLSGDHVTTAQAVGAQVGIPASNIIAGVLPDQKAEKIRYLQRSLTKGETSSNGFGRNTRLARRATVAMVGDGINDAPALATADVGIAIGSGSDVAVSSASFILVSSDLTALLTLTALSRAVFRRVWFNFGWALVYNVIAMPIAAGVLYPIRAGGNHVRLDPVWASLAMALSSVSVVCSSLALRTKVRGVGFRVERTVEKEGEGGGGGRGRGGGGEEGGTAGGETGGNVKHQEDAWEGSRSRMG